MIPAIIDAKNPRYIAPDAIDIDVKWTSSNGEYIPFTASSTDPEPHGRMLFEQAKNGKFGAVTPLDEKSYLERLSHIDKTLRLREIERAIKPLRDEALAGTITDPDRERLARLVQERKSLKS